MNQKQAADDSAEVVNQRSHGLHTELFANQQNRAEDAAGKEEQLRGQQDSREAHAQRGFYGIESVEPPMDVPRGEDFSKYQSCAQHQVHGGQDYRKRALPLFFMSGFAIAGEDGDKGDGSCTADQKIGNHVRQNKGGVECVRLHTTAEEPGDVFNPHQAHDARQKRGGHQHQSRSECRMRVRRTQQSQGASPSGVRRHYRLCQRTFCHWC